MMKRMVVALCLLSAVIFTAVPAALAQTVMRMGMGDAIDSDQGAFSIRFKEAVESLSGGKIRIELFPNGSLGSETEMLQNTRRGTLDLATIGVGNAVPFVPDLGVLTMPYLLESHYDAIKATTGGLGQQWNERSIAKGGFRILGWTYSNFRFVTNSRRPVRKLEDIKGMKIRVPHNNIILATFRAWGANPVPMDWAETFTALQQKVVDGQENPYIVNYTTKFHEVQDYLTEVHYQYSLQPLMIGERKWKTLDKETQDILIRAGMEAQQYAIAYQILEAEKAKKGMQDAGVEICYLEDEEQWKQLAREKVWPEFYDFIGGRQNLDMVMQSLGKK
ncbi:TRAP transporter substrate-binding protein [Desulfobotulus sp. H1]|uniref:TRAP transporter substrate-binding protein n=1 Tax=Desulfobotulus pelophilus TaxID=2823377 RepID=A0ABT3N5Z3_9BACT|nr:TRAP transporter substrate-binding protein [Desulfobotulus pelophilus]MCW7752869.1 TRAP transporter substrate-binding protein [Desulfobotulus pelophilus]